MMKNPKVSIVIPLFVMGERFIDDLSYFFQLDYLNYEIIIVSDKKFILPYNKIKIIYTGKNKTSPAEKRDLALLSCTGDVCAFIDDDAYPGRKWLKYAIRHFNDESVAAVCGPGLTPKSDNLWQKAGGAVYSSWLGSGKNIYRFSPKQLREVDDYPAYNLLVRRSILEKIGGFSSTFYGGEDTKVCLSIININKKIIYDPTVIVYHHRRPLYISHLRQISNVGLHRGYFVKAYPKTSRRIIYFLPSTAVLTIFSILFLSFFFKSAMALFFLLMGLWFTIGFVSGIIVQKDFKIAFLAAIGIIFTQLTYGLAFLKGLTIKELRR